jgi:hypothetical protein
MGAYESAKEGLFALPNVHYLGNRTVREVPAYVRHMDVCLLCYALTDYTRYIFPLKLHDTSRRPTRGRIRHPHAAGLRIVGSHREKPGRMVWRDRGVACSR